LKRIANEKKENRLSVFQGSNNKKEKKKNNSEEDDLIYGQRNCDIGKSPSIELHLLLLCENSADQHLVTTARVDRISRPELWIWITSVSAVMWKLWVCVSGTSALLWKLMQSRMKGDSLFSFSQLILSAELLFFSSAE
jgi:hypothetical protein